MKKICVLIVLWLALGLLGSVTTLAHHSDAEYDMDPLHIVRFEATVIEFRLMNPHLQLVFEAKDAKGNTQTWTAFGNPPNRAARIDGYTSKTFTPGEKLTVFGHVSRYGRNIMSDAGIIRANGEIVKGSGEAALKRYLEAYPNRKPQDVRLAGAPL
jgi:hypothetical protein